MGFFDGLTMPQPAKRDCYLLTKANQLGLSDADKKQLFALADDLAWSASALCDALNQRGFVISRGVIDRHRKHACPCSDKAA